MNNLEIWKNEEKYSNKREKKLFSKIVLSLKNMNHKLFFALLVMGLVPTIYYS